MVSRPYRFFCKWPFGESKVSRYLAVYYQYQECVDQIEHCRGYLVRIVNYVIVFLLLALVLVTGVLFSIQNTSVVPLDLLIVQLSERSLALWLIVAFAIGGLFGLAISTYTIIRLKGESVLLRRRLTHKNKELAGYLKTSRLPATKS